MTINGLHLLAAIVAIVAVYVFVHYVEWRRADRNRRFERLVHRNLQRQGGLS